MDSEWRTDPSGITFMGVMGEKGLEHGTPAWPVQYFSGGFYINMVPNLYSTKDHFSLPVPQYL